MKFVRVLVFLSIFSLAGIAGSTFFLPEKVTIKRSILVRSSYDNVYNYLSDITFWPRWMSWGMEDLDAKYTYSEITSGKGAWMKWNSRVIGKGQITFTDVDVFKQIDYEFYDSNFNIVFPGRIEFERDGFETNVHWYYEGVYDEKPIMRWIGVFADRIIGRDFEEGLENLKLILDTDMPTR